MKAEWEECPRGDLPPQYAGIYVTMNRRGEIMLSKNTYNVLGQPAAVLLLFDRTNRRIGIKPTAKNIRNAYPLLVSGRCGARKVHAFRLIREYNIDLPASIKFENAEIDDDGILRLDLRTAQIPLRVTNHWKNRAPAQRPN